MSDLGAVEQVGAQLVLLDGDAFRAGLEAATKSLQAFNDEQERAAELAEASADKIADSAKESASAVTDASGDMEEASATTATAIEAAADKIVASQEAIATAQAEAADAAAASAAKQVEAADVASAAAADETARVKTAAATTAAAWDTTVAGATKVLKYAGVIGGVMVYEGVKKYLAFNQQITQMGIDAGVSAKQLPAFAAAAIKVSDATGIAATNVGDMMYRIASANPKIKITTASMEAMAAQAGNLVVLAGNTGDYDSIARAYGAIVSNAIPLTTTGKPLTYSAAGGKSINEWMLATTGHGDVKMGDLVSALGTGILPVAKTYGISLNELGAAFDVLAPAMNASAASTRLKTAFGMLGSPSSKASEAYELFGGNVTTAASTLRSKGLGALLTYLNNLTTGHVTGSTFASAFYGGGLGSLTGGTKGVGTGAGEYLRACSASRPPRAPSWKAPEASALSPR